MMKQLPKPDRSSVFIDHLMGEVEPALLDFIKTNINSFIKWDLIRFFYKNRPTIDTAENIAHYVGQKLSAIEQALAELVDSGIMAKRALDETASRSMAFYPLDLVYRQGLMGELHPLYLIAPGGAFQVSFFTLTLAMAVLRDYLASRIPAWDSYRRPHQPVTITGLFTPFLKVIGS